MAIDTEALMHDIKAILDETLGSNSGVAKHLAMRIGCAVEGHRITSEWDENFREGGMYADADKP